MRYCFGGKANMLSLDAFPAVSLKDAREKRDGIKKQLAGGINRRFAGTRSDQHGSPNTFGAIADEYIANLETNGFDGDTVSLDGSLLLLGEARGTLGVCRRLAEANLTATIRPNEIDIPISA
jgi:hypothetical protein